MQEEVNIKRGRGEKSSKEYSDTFSGAGLRSL